MPARKPTALKLVEGNRSKTPKAERERQIAAEPTYAPLTDSPPDWLPREAKAEWRRLTYDLKRIPGLLQRPDRAAMIALCTEWDRYVEAVKDIKDRGVQVMGMSRGESGMVKNPSVQVARETLTALLALWGRFGLTPADRARIQAPQKGGNSDPLDDLLD